MYKSLFDAAEVIYRLREVVEDPELRDLVDVATSLVEGGSSIEEAVDSLRDVFGPFPTTGDQIAAALGVASFCVAVRSEGSGLDD